MVTKQILLQSPAYDRDYKLFLSVFFPLLLRNNKFQVAKNMVTKQSLQLLQVYVCAPSAAAAWE
jgi:hypothetical protein